MSFSCPNIAARATRNDIGQPIVLSFVVMQVKPERQLIYPLNEFYEKSGLPLPRVVEIEGRDVPEPYRSLLVHQHDMTPTLEDAYGQSIQLRVLQYEFSGNVVSRQVVLVTEGGARPVAFGAIKIELEHFPPEARRLVLERKHPLGAILRAQGIEHASRPDTYIQVQADAVIDSALGLAGGGLLYGRRNVISDTAQHTLAQVVEILPPSESWPPSNGISRLERNREHK
jgi:chorismate-pyruvate lyase